MQTPSSNHSHNIYENPACAPSRTKSYYSAEKRQDVRTPRAINQRRGKGSNYTPDYGFERIKRLPEMLESL